MRAFCLILLLSTTTARGLGGTVGNGGDTVFCEPTGGNPFKGYHSLDYLLTLRVDNSDLVRVQSWEESRTRLLGLFASKYPDLARLFRDFLSSVPGDHTPVEDNLLLAQRIWLEAPFGLIDIKDERIVRKLPPNCYKLRSEPDEINVIQAVIRQTNQDVVIYNYDPSITDTLKREVPLQYSFLLVHEWLWDYVQDVEVIRRVNRFLHSNALERLGSAELKLTLENLGLSLKFSQPLPFCARSKEVRLFIERVQQRPCIEIQSYHEFPNDSRPLFVDLKNRGITHFRPGDFTGLGIVRTLNFSQNQIAFLFEDQLSSLTSLIEINGADNRIKSLPENIFRNLVTLRRINLSNNQIESVPAGLFTDLRYGDIDIDLSGNRIQELPKGIIAGLCQITQTFGSTTLNLLDNPLFSDQIHWEERVDCPGLKIRVRPATTRFSCSAQCYRKGEEQSDSTRGGLGGSFERNCLGRNGRIVRFPSDCGTYYCLSPFARTEPVAATEVNEAAARARVEQLCRPMDKISETQVCGGQSIQSRYSQQFAGAITCSQGN